jgi:hypothetical protein
MFWRQDEKESFWKRDQVRFAEKAHEFLCCDIPTVAGCAACEKKPDQCENKMELFRAMPGASPFAVNESLQDVYMGRLKSFLHGSGRVEFGEGKACRCRDLYEDFCGWLQGRLPCAPSVKTFAKLVALSRCPIDKVKKRGECWYSGVGIVQGGGDDLEEKKK